VLRDGRSRIVYFPDDVDRTFWRSWNRDLGFLLSNAVRWAGREPYSAKVSGPGLLDIFYWETEPGLALHILNYTTPALMKGPARDIFAVGPQEVRLRIPAGLQVASNAITLSNQQQVPLRVDGDGITFTLPQVGEYEVVAIHRRS
jgi:hypothetical protein